MRILAVILLTVTLAAPAAAQRDKQPARPRLDAAADTNDAMAYYNAGMTLLRRDPAKAADAFHWAAQLNPGSADAFYARRVAMLLARPRFLESYWMGDRRTLRNPDVRRADSLYLHALTINPFFYRKLDAELFDAVVREFANSAVGPGRRCHGGEVRDRYIPEPRAGRHARVEGLLVRPLR